MDTEDKKDLQQEHRHLSEAVEAKKLSIQGRNMLLEARKSGVIAPLMTEIAKKRRELSDLYDEIDPSDSHSIRAIQDQRELLSGLIDWVNGDNIEELNREIAEIEADMVLIDARIKEVDVEEDGLVPAEYIDQMEK